MTFTWYLESDTVEATFLDPVAQCCVHRDPLPGLGSLGGSINLERELRVQSR